LPLAFVVAEYVNGVTLPKPAMQLSEEFPALNFCNNDLRRAPGERTESVEG